MMEVYTDPLGRSVEPEFALAFVDERFSRISKLGETTQRNIVEKHDESFSDKKSWQASRKATSRSFGRAYTIMLSGRKLVFRPAGQNIPNRESVKLDTGTKFFIDTKTIWQRWRAEKELLVKVFGEDTTAELFSDENEIVTLTSGVDLVGHEVSHNSFIMRGSRASIGRDEYRQLEEHKADLSILSILNKLEFLTPDQIIAVVKGSIADILRRINRSGDDSSKPYINSAVSMVNSMVDAGVLIPGEERWSIDLDGDKVNSFLDAQDRIFRDMVEVYDAQSPELAREFMERYYSPSEAVVSLLRLVNSK